MTSNSTGTATKLVDLEQGTDVCDLTTPVITHYLTVEEIIALDETHYLIVEEIIDLDAR